MTRTPGQKVAQERWRQRHREQVREYSRDYDLRANYGISAAEYDVMLERQGGVCLLCLRPPTPKRRLAVDHNHATDQVRGLLCHPCNRFLGHVHDNPVLLHRMAEYLETNV